MRAVPLIKRYAVLDQPVAPQETDTLISLRGLTFYSNSKQTPTVINHYCVELEVTFRDSYQTVNTLKGKCKALPLQAWTGPEGSRRLRLPDFKTIGT